MILTIVTFDEKIIIGKYGMIGAKLEVHCQKKKFCWMF